MSTMMSLFREKRRRGNRWSGDELRSKLGNVESKNANDNEQVEGVEGVSGCTSTALRSHFLIIAMEVSPRIRRI